MSDSIEQEIVVNADLDHVWSVLTDPAAVSQWFGEYAEFELHEGAPARFGWDEYGWFDARIERVQPPTVFSFRWAEDAGVPLGQGPSTLVEFTLTSNDDGTTIVHVLESGFAAFPADRHDRAVAEHVDGWRIELEHLRALLVTPQGTTTPTPPQATTP